MPCTLPALRQRACFDDKSIRGVSCNPALLARAHVRQRGAHLNEIDAARIVCRLARIVDGLNHVRPSADRFTPRRIAPASPTTTGVHSLRSSAWRSSVFAVISGPMPATSPSVTASRGLFTSLSFAKTDPGTVSIAGRLAPAHPSAPNPPAFVNTAMPSAAPPTMTPCRNPLEQAARRCGCPTHPAGSSAARAPSPPTRPTMSHSLALDQRSKFAGQLSRDNRAFAARSSGGEHDDDIGTRLGAPRPGDARRDSAS